MAVFEDLTGMKFGRLTVLELDHKEPRKNRNGNKYYWRCVCECGKEKVIRSDSLKYATRSCGCLQINDLTGKTFGRLTVLERIGSNKGHSLYKCACSCGVIKVVEASGLISGGVKSCGCYNREKSTKHGLEGTPIYETWHTMKNRCFNPNCESYKNYGGRGITVCEEWKNSFQAFYDYVLQLEHFGEEGYTLDRIDNNGNYEPSNVRWADKKTQGRNRRTNRVVEYEGQIMCLKDAAEKSGINYQALKSRIRHGDTGERLFRPVKGR